MPSYCHIGAFVPRAGYMRSLYILERRLQGDNARRESRDRYITARARCSSASGTAALTHRSKAREKAVLCVPDGSEGVCSRWGWGGYFFFGSQQGEHLGVESAY